MFGRTRLALVAAVAVAAMMALATSAAFAGEITGNGKLKEVHANSACAYSGQEDLQWYTTDGNTMLKPNPVKGDPAHSQNWGHTEGRDGGANETNAFGFEWGCNAHEFGLKNP
jgi:hypothetical protein